jgi:hypothetical protein
LNQLPKLQLIFRPRLADASLNATREEALMDMPAVPLEDTICSDILDAIISQ